jgi:hypothetical protein
MKLIGINWGKYSNDSQLVTFSPPRAIVDLRGRKEFQGDNVPFFIRVVQIFVPKNRHETVGYSFFFSSRRILRLFRYFLIPLFWYELVLDKKVMEGIGEMGVDLKNSQLGKFDKGVARGRRLLLEHYNADI